jgi:hypothetical protein
VYLYGFLTLLNQIYRTKTIREPETQFDYEKRRERKEREREKD